jgi:ComF family protein
LYEDGRNRQIVVPGLFATTVPFQQDPSPVICKRCAEAIEIEEPIVSSFTLTTGEAQRQELIVSSGIEYTERVKKLIRRFKYDHDLALTKDLGAILANAFNGIDTLVPTHGTIVVPVPLHWWREHKRGYNQAAIVADAFCKINGLRFCGSALKRIKWTKPQNKLSKESRENNLTDAIRGNRRLLTGKTVIIIDDVCTSGATLAACATEAYRCGAKKVYGLTIARAVLRNISLAEFPLGSKVKIQTDQLVSLPNESAAHSFDLMQ